MTAIKIETARLDNLQSECLVLGYFSDERPPRGYCGLLDWRLNGMISRLMVSGKITGEYQEKVLIAPPKRIPSTKIMLLGLGEITGITYDILYTMGYVLSGAAAGLGWEKYAFEIPAAGRCPLQVPIMTEAVITGLYDFYATRGESWKYLSPILLSRESDLKEILLGLERFRKNVGDDLIVDIPETVKEGLDAPLTLFPRG
ncbi:MAG: M17 family peptidase N-terminal domain-containing protein [Syntrophales bacterium]